MVHTEINVVCRREMAAWGAGVGPLQFFFKSIAVLIASCSCADGKAGHHTLQRNIKNVSKSRTLQ